ncbi:hypothetical protein F5146DRAFT_1002416 [Armillaria mellea]|nr:hypothetical protein F5146DRAFT_1002416 [Armillaria mellea]
MAPKVIIDIGAYNFDAMKASPLQLTIQDLVDSNDVVLDRSQVLRCCVLAKLVKKKAGAVPTDQPMPLGYEYLVEATRREPYFTIQERKAFPYIDEATGNWKVPNKIIKINDLLPAIPMQKVEPLSAIERAELEELREWELMENRRRREREKKFQNHAGPSRSSPITAPSSSTNTSTSTIPSTSSIHKPTLSAAAKPFVPQSLAPDVATSSSASSSNNLASLKFHKKDGVPEGPKAAAQAMDVDDPGENSLLNYNNDA